MGARKVITYLVVIAVAIASVPLLSSLFNTLCNSRISCDKINDGSELTTTVYKDNVLSFNVSDNCAYMHTLSIEIETMDDNPENQVELYVSIDDGFGNTVYAETTVCCQTGVQQVDFTIDNEEPLMRYMTVITVGCHSETEQNGIRVLYDGENLTYSYEGTNAPSINGLYPALIIVVILVLLFVTIIQFRFKDFVSVFDRLRWYDLLLPATSCLIATVLFNQYFDLPLTTMQVYDLIDLTCHGKFFQFYSITGEYAINGKYLGDSGLTYGAYYNILLYIILAIPLIPVYIIDKLGLITDPEYISLLISDFTVLSSVIALTASLRSLCKTIGLDTKRSNLVCLLLMSSPLLLFTIVECGQLDAIHVALAVWGVDAYLKKNYKRFAILFSFAIAIKPFAIFLFIPLLILRFKDIEGLIKHIIYAAIIPLLTSFIMMLDPGYCDFHLNMTNHYAFDQRIIEASIGPWNGKFISLFMLSWFLIIAYCYTRKIESDKDTWSVLLISFITYGSFVTLVKWHPQWLTLFMPFMILIVLIASDSKLFIWLNIIMEYSLIMFIQYVFQPYVDITMTNSGLLNAITGHKYTGGGINKWLPFFPITAPYIFYTMFFASVLLMVIMLFRNKDSLEKAKSEDIEVKRWWLCFRNAPLILLNLFFIFMYFVD